MAAGLRQGQSCSKGEAGSSACAGADQPPPPPLAPATVAPLSAAACCTATPAEIEILKRPDGSEWEVGRGGFGVVYKGLRNGVQVVAVKVLSVSAEPSQAAA